MKMITETATIVAIRATSLSAMKRGMSEGMVGPARAGPTGNYES
jgi:hypothetical protein